MKEEYREENTTSSRIEGRHSVLEALRAGSLIERLFVQKGCQDGPVLTILREAKKADVMVDFVPKERLDFMSETKNHQGVVAVLSAFAYSTIDDMFALAVTEGRRQEVIMQQYTEQLEEQIKKQAGQHALPADEVTVKADAKGVIHKIELHLETEETSKVTKEQLRQFKNQLCSQYKLQKEQVEIWI